MKKDKKIDTNITNLENYLKLKKRELKVAQQRVLAAKMDLDKALTDKANKKAIEESLKKPGLIDIVAEIYRIPAENEPCVFKTPTDILNDLIKYGKVDSEKVNCVQIGYCLKKLGFNKTSKYIDKLSRWGYDVINLIDNPYTLEEIEIIDKSNIKSLAYCLIKENYRVPYEDESFEYVQSKDIFFKFKNSKKINKSSEISAVTIGLALKKLGFIKKMKKINNKPRYMYRVIKIEKP